MDVFKVKGILVRETNYGDYDKILSVLTEEHGVLSVLAKGARSRQSKQASALLLLGYYELVLSRGKGELFYIRESELLEPFSQLHSDVERLSMAVYFADAALHISPGENTGALRLLLNTLHFLTKPDRDMDQLRTVYETKLLSLAGFAPSVQCCIDCGQTDQVAGFDPVAGGIFCQSCGKNRTLIPLSLQTIQYIRYLQQAGLKEAFSLSAPRKVVLEALHCLEKFIGHHIAYDFKTLHYLNSLRSKQIPF